MRLYIKNMVCNRCVMVVTDILGQCGAAPSDVALGRADIADNTTSDQMAQIAQELKRVGFELIDDKRDALVEQIKKHVQEYVRLDDEAAPNINLSAYIADRVGRDYSSLSNLFSEAEGRTVEQYYILVRIEYVKELMAYGDLSLSEIAYKTRFSSAAHLSNQFKRVTGMTPSEFKRLHPFSRTPLDKV